ncbi:MAG: N-acetyl-gamma-glutamyl-phosphate reductase [Oscillospiraceae bacterium]|nr:N-acetyl-gamma-glutamyl-phosphate reductase [Oscillospiraceae bacterium]
MNKTKVFIDGKDGTTGLKIYERLNRPDIEIITADPEKAKDRSERREKINEADIVFLCLPDEAAKESVELGKGSGARFIDASTAHRTAPGWVYGFPELSPGQREKIRSAKYAANPGCHATGFIALVYPLIQNGIMPRSYPASCFSVTGYSGGGLKMIGEYENPGRSEEYGSPRQYSLNLSHKHLPEMQIVTGLEHPPVFSPVVADFYSGMTVTVPLHPRLLNKNCNAEDIINVYKGHYAGCEYIIIENTPANGFLPANNYTDTNELHIFVYGNKDCITVSACFDNLGKGASGAAVQNMDIMIGEQR